MILRDHIRQTLAEVVAAFEDASVYQAEVQFDVDVATKSNLAGDIETNYESRGVRITVVIDKGGNDK